jgi:hypothetical protein
MMTRQASELRGISPPRTRPMALTALARILLIPVGHLLFREGSDGFVPMMVAATIIASALLLALD